MVGYRSRLALGGMLIQSALATAMAATFTTTKVSHPCTPDHLQKIDLIMAAADIAQRGDRGKRTIFCHIQQQLQRDIGSYALLDGRS
jgi:hypothetical protein